LELGADQGSISRQLHLVARLITPAIQEGEEEGEEEGEKEGGGPTAREKTMQMAPATSATCRPALNTHRASHRR